MDQRGIVQECRRHPVKSMQGHRESALVVGPSGVEGDRRHALVDAASGRLLSAKTVPALLEATGHDDAVVLPDGTRIATHDGDADRALSDWLGRPIRLATTTPDVALSYQMTFDPPDDDADLFDIPAPPGTFLDLGHLHLVTTATLEGCAAARPDLDWDVRRFRPNLLLAVDGDPFVEQDWVGRHLRLGTEVVVEVLMPTVRCAMPLRAQPATETDPALPRAPEHYEALRALNVASPNHLGIYANVVAGGTVSVGDAVVVVDP